MAGATLSQAEGGPKGQLRPVAGEAGGMQPLECGEARLKPGGSCGRLGRVPLLPRVEGTGLGPSHDYRAVDPGHMGTPECRVQGHITQNMKHRHVARE